jgi:hypothetical protein
VLLCVLAIRGADWHVWLGQLDKLHTKEVRWGVLLESEPPEPPVATSTSTLTSTSTTSDQPAKVGDVDASTATTATTTSSTDSTAAEQDDDKVRLLNTIVESPSCEASPILIRSTDGFGAECQARSRC